MFGLFKIKGKWATLNKTPGKKIYKEKTIVVKGKEYRIWDPFKSKLAGAIYKGLKIFPFERNSRVLYLGASKGTTPSHLSDIITEGEIYCVELSPQCAQELLEIASDRENIIPICADARHPEEYKEVGVVDVIYMDVSQPDQADILIKNAKQFLRPKGYALMAVKSQSISSTKKPKEVFKEVISALSKHFKVIQQFRLEPYDKDHLFLVLQFKG